MDAPAPGRIAVKVYYEDTDALGVVYYANYLKYLERGRTELFDGRGRAIADWNRAGFNFAVYKANLTFLAPARLGDRLEVLTRPLPGGSDYRVKLRQEIRREGKLITEAEVHLVCVDGAFALQPFPEEILEALRGMAGGGDG